MSAGDVIVVGNAHDTFITHPPRGATAYRVDLLLQSTLTIPDRREVTGRSTMRGQARPTPATSYLSIKSA
jgi:hypothetical protein